MAWSKDSVKKLVPDLQKELIAIIKKTRGRKIESKPPSKVPQRKESAGLGTLTNKARELETKRADMDTEFDKKARKEWKARNERGEGSVYQTLNAIGTRKLDLSFLNKRIEVYTSFDIGDGKTALRWCIGVVTKISDGTWMKPGARTAKFKENEAAEIDWDAVDECNMPACTTIEELKERKWNKDCKGTWRRHLGDETYGL